MVYCSCLVPARRVVMQNIKFLAVSAKNLNIRHPHSTAGAIQPNVCVGKVSSGTNCSIIQSNSKVDKWLI